MTEAQARAAMKADLAKSGIPDKAVPAWKLVDAAEMAKLFPKADIEWAYKIPYPRPFKDTAAVCRYKILAFKPLGFGAVREQKIKYLQPPKTPAGVYFPDSIDWSKFKVESADDLIIVEGEKKAVAGCLAGFNVIGLGGVWSWSSKAQGVGFLPVLDGIHWEGRIVYICFDSDTLTNPDVAVALSKLVLKLTMLGAHVFEATIPPLGNEGKAGLDDFLTHYGKIGANKLRDHLRDNSHLGDAARKLFEFNSKYAVVVTPTVILDETRQDVFDRPIQVLHAPDRWGSVVVKNEVVKVLNGNGAMVDKGVSELWLSSPMRRTYSALTYDPGQPRVLNHGTRYNSWQGLGCEAKKGDVRPFLDLIDYFFPLSEDKALKLWLLRWFGYPLKHLGSRLSTVVGLWSHAQGTGKSMIGDVTLGPIYGTNYVSIPQREFEGDFNSWALNKQFVMVDEVTARDARERADAIKKMITENTIRVNEKFIPHYEVPARENFFLTSNSPSAFYVDDEDRRYFVWEVKEKRLPTSFYQHYIGKWVGWQRGKLPNGPGLPALLWYFQNELDYGDFDPMAAAPKTEAKTDMAAIHRHPAEHWLRTFFDRRKADPTQVMREVWTPSELCALYKADGGGNERMSVNAFGAFVSSAGFVRWRGEDKTGKAHRLVAVTNFDRWKTAKPAEWIAEARKGVQL